MKSSVGHASDIETSELPRTRRDLLRSGGAAAVAGLLGVFGVATATAAKTGDAIRAGRKTTSSDGTVLESRKGPALHARASAGSEPTGLRGSSSHNEGIGVHGHAASGKGEPVGVQGNSSAAGGTAGRFVATGGGTAIEARSGQKQGVALRTKGRLQLTERSGVSPVSGGAEFVIPVSGGLNAGSFVLATLQDHHPGVHVEAATVLDAEKGLIVVRLNQALPAPASVGWIVLD